MATSEIVWALGLLRDLQIPQIGPVPIYYDNIAAIHIAANPVFHERTKHIKVDCHFIRDKWKEKVIDLVHIRSHEQEADLLTKSVSGDVQCKLLSKLGSVNIFAPLT
ncbi:hypothetical protein QN277_022938 [Acacia crassicarpa]|uniref:Copia protein n=1 Tax=Acacia crassicarpa TaxID=499986 RepID=A0AAE1MR64_9FABA|nr:hypothetical protein QN277_022938 [Acacia crassicarpa]